MEQPSVIELTLDVLEVEERFENDLIFYHARTREHQIERPLYLQVNREQLDTLKRDTRTMHSTFLHIEQVIAFQVLQRINLLHDGVGIQVTNDVFLVGIIGRHAPH